VPERLKGLLDKLRDGTRLRDVGFQTKGPPTVPLDRRAAGTGVLCLRCRRVVHHDVRAVLR
jgi:hypothetical protein